MVYLLIQIMNNESSYELELKIKLWWHIRKIQGTDKA